MVECSCSGNGKPRIFSEYQKTWLPMSQFEFIFVLISIIAGLALSQLLASLARPPRDSRGRVDITHIAFTISTIILLITVWWATFRWQKFEAWTFTEFFLLCCYISVFYIWAVILNPLRTTAQPSFTQVRNKFYGVLILYCVLEPLVIHIRDGEFSPWYIPMIVHIFIFSVLGISLRKEMFDRVLSIWLVVLNTGWTFLARFTV